MSNSPKLIESLARERHGERYRAAAPAPRAAAASPRLRRRRPALEMTRHRAGWLLVGLGLRLLAGRGEVAAPRARLIGQ